MLVSKSKCRIVGIELQQAHLNFVNPALPPLTADFVLIRDDEERAGLLQRRLEWSPRTLAALAELQDAMEAETLEHVFEPQPPQEQAREPEQM